MRHEAGGLRAIKCGIFSIFVSFSALMHGSHIAAQDAKATPSEPKSGDVALDVSRVYVRVGKVGLGHEHAASAKLASGVLHLDAPDANGSFGKLVFDMTSFEADSEESRKYVGLSGTTDEDTRKKVNENLLGKEVLDVKKFPTATFEVKRILKLKDPSTRGLPKYKFEGDFTLHGTTKALAFVADVEDVKGWHHLRGGFAIRQSDYGMKPYTTMLGAVGVADRLVIFGDLIVAP